MSARAYSALLLCLGLGCGHPARIILEEPKDEAFVRVVLTFAGPDKTVTVLPADAPYSMPIGVERGRGDVVAVWVLRYSQASVVRSFAALSGKTAAEAASLLSASFVPVGSEPPELPTTAEALYAALDPSADGPVSYEVRPYASWEHEISDHPERTFRLDLPSSVVCGAVSVTHIPLPPNVNLGALATMSRDEVVFTGTATGAPAIGYYDHGSFRFVQGPRPSGSWSSLLGWDPLNQRGVAIDSARQGVRFDMVGQTYAFPIGHIISELAVGRDGTLNILDAGQLFQETPQGWSDQQGSTGFARLRVVNKNRRVAWLNDWVRVNLSNNDNWEPNGTVAFRVPFDITADSERFYAILDTGTLYTGFDSPATWRYIDGIDPERARTVAALEGGRFAVGGNNGYLAVQLEGHLCVFEEGPGLLSPSSAAPQGGVAFFAVRNPTTNAVHELVKVDVGDAR
ncbi:MAG: hypothetical protein U1E65_36465 [Myxococcota bacterium]